MKKIDLGKSGLNVSEISLGCMRISDIPYEDAEKAVLTSINSGIDFFDHADIYGKGKSEEIFGQIIKKNDIKRENIIIQTKCGIRINDFPDKMYKTYFDFSKEYIINSVNESLKRLNIDYIDILLLHRPDTLMEPEEVAEAFNILHNSGKVRNFGVSNQNEGQIKLLQKYIKQKLIVNQLQFGIMHSGIIDSGLNVNMKNLSGIDRDGSILEYCRLKDITIQAWSPFQYGFFEGVFLNNPEFKNVNEVINKIAEKKNVSNSAIVIAWILRHPAKIQPIIGTMNFKRISKICKASEIQLSREEWYEIYCSAGNTLP
ncbi:aldo/keto reductase family oxidoreductase [Leptotrichia sp. OH3620_COT-345]|uniref:aldo/keto reductase n=1 Tax=Leptotrichia sp. OH3620_COT-345 TaxID=2491048 RepID=UPI000F64FDC8|nr:aldo/keto reductase [Leptotrichia sp. OH3620_COT-345]RRD40888.1 aldo/keto reductase family oxidoreductase [Leptotrichia sp. OH3620_COT-345]